eukprot:TRINITY_DN66093_c0_g1_i1.p1 TRINITY_DN66093_c0_g1~~TRINITY_DN66093_c0_g1_i1.p1  ORF type:complete len:549 (+),score=177.56 TRINITY_DN66093_c0_g1_i1:120-1649(+)
MAPGRGGGALRVTRALLRPTPDEQGPAPQFGGRQYQPAPQGHQHFRKCHESMPVMNSQMILPEFVKEFDRERIRAYHEHRHQFFFYTRKTPEFWMKYNWHYKCGQAFVEWREWTVRKVVLELIKNDAVQCGPNVGYEVTRIINKIVTLCKDGSRTSRRILQEFFEYTPWSGGKFRPEEGEQGDPRLLYKALDDYPQRFKKRNGGYALMTPIHTDWSRTTGGPFIDIDLNKSISRACRRRMSIVEMVDRDLSIFHRGQLITGDKGPDVWDQEKDRPQLDSGYDGQPRALDLEDQYIKEQQKLEINNRRVMFGDAPDTKDAKHAGDFVANPQNHIGFQRLQADNSDRSFDHGREMVAWHRPKHMQSDAPPERLREWPTDLEDIDKYIRDMRFAATERELYKDENFYKLFPKLTDDAWIEKIYRPYMKLSDEKQMRVYKWLENSNIHNVTGFTLLTDGLPIPRLMDKERMQDHFRDTWKRKLEYLKHHTNDPRDEPVVSQPEKDARNAMRNK